MSAWINAFRGLRTAEGSSEEKQAALEANLRDRHDQLGCLSRQLRTAVQEAQDARAHVETLHRALAGHSELFMRIVEREKYLHSVDNQLRSFSGVQKASQREGMSISIKEISTAFSTRPNPVTPIRHSDCDESGLP